MKNLILFMRNEAHELQIRGSYGTAHIYRSSANAVEAFYGRKTLVFERLTPKLLKQFETYLRQQGCSWNTISTYLRTIRTVYNRAVETKNATYVPQLFRHVYTGTKADRKRAMEQEEIAALINETQTTNNLPDDLKQTKAFFLLMFMLRGLPFVDLVYLRKSDLNDNILTYQRRKTGRTLSISLTPEAMELLDIYRNTDIKSPYLFSLLRSPIGSREAYREYQLALRNFNRQLTLLKKELGLDSNLSSYTARHTWATMAYYCEVHPGIISEAMGHSSISVTETYLKPFRNKKIDEANARVIAFSSQL